MFSRSTCRLAGHFLSFLLILTFLASCASQKIIVNELDEREANEILVFLSNRGIEASKVQAVSAGGGGSKLVLWNISVDTTQSTEAMALLNQAGLPRRRSQNLLNIFKDVGLVPSEMQEKIKYQSGLAEQIASTIRKFDGILDADVQVSFPEEDPLNPNAVKQKITASVYVKHNGILDDPNAHIVTKIKRLVSSSVPGLDFDNVTVVGDRARYGDTTTGIQGLSPEEEKQYFNIWSIVLAKESISRFRLIFFSFSILIVLLLLSVIWIGWKFAYLIKASGGIKKLFTPHQFRIEDLHEVPQAKKKEGQESKEGEEPNEEDQKTEDHASKDKDFDET
jgi:type III secretion protein J